MKDDHRPLSIFYLFVSYPLPILLRSHLLCRYPFSVFSFGQNLAQQRGPLTLSLILGVLRVFLALLAFPVCNIQK